MRHQKRIKKLGRTAAHRKAMFNNMVTSLLKSERIETTIQKAKVLRTIVEPIITRAKVANSISEPEKILHQKREVMKSIKDRKVIVKLFEDIALRYMNREGGYTRIYKLDKRAGDNAQMVLIELVEERLETQTKKSDTKSEKTKLGKIKSDNIEKESMKTTEDEKQVDDKNE